MRSSLLLLLVACRIDSKLAGGEDPGFDQGDSAPGDLDHDSSGSSAEACDGLDNDGDGAVDEDFPDTDGDGIADCLDQTCALLVPAAGHIALDGACSGDVVPSAEPWTVGEAWRWSALSSSPTHDQVIVMPVVGHLTDDDGDGRADEGDIPSIVVPVYVGDDVTGPGTLVALAGDDGHELWSWGDGAVLTGGTPAIADLDGDGWSDVVAFAADYSVVALDHTGTVLWQTRGLDTVHAVAKAIVVADLWGDGSPDVIADNVILDAATGEVEATLSKVASYHRAPVAADLDGDGIDEILLEGSAFSPDGTLLWTIQRLGGCGVFAGVADLDGDPSTGEVVWSLNERVTVYSHDGRELADAVLPDANPPGPPVLADMDGDGVPEIGVEGQGSFTVLGADATVRWSMPVDALYNAGAAFDFDGDGVYEPVIADNTHLWILDGRTGEVRWSAADAGSLTYFGNIVVADVNGDGSAELVEAGNDIYGGWHGVRVWENTAGGWPGTGSTWGGHDYAVTNLPDSGEIPTRPVPGYVAYNLFRARPAEGPGVDLTAEIADVCAASCGADGVVQVSVQVGNLGALDVPAGAKLTLYAVQSDGSHLAVGTDVLPLVASGATTDGLVFSVPAVDTTGYGFVAVVDDDGSGRSALPECDEANNDGAWGDGACW